jgi:hypothetical protein
MDKWRLSAAWILGAAIAYSATIDVATFVHNRRQRRNWERATVQEAERAKSDGIPGQA